MFRLFDEKKTELFANLGLTQTQLNLYFILNKMEKADAKTLSKHSSMPTSMVYRTLDELQKKGLVEKEIAKPYTFRATPIQFGLQLLIIKKIEECKEIQKKAKIFLREIQSKEEYTLNDQEYKFIIIEGKERIIQRMKEQHDSAQRNVDIITTFRREMQILHYCYENYAKALNRGVRYRVILEKRNAEEGLPENALSLMAKPNFGLELCSNCVNINAAVFDGKEATFNIYPSKLLTESPIIWTNQTSFLKMFQKTFEDTWESALKLDGK